MADELIREPRTLDTALGRSDDLSLVTIAAFLASTALWHIREFREVALPPEDEIAFLGFGDPRKTQLVERHSFNVSQFRTPDIDAIPAELNRERFYHLLAELILVASRSGEGADSARAVAFALGAPDDLVRSCALSAAIDLFKLETLDVWSRARWYLNRGNVKETTLQIVGIILSRVYGSMPSAMLHFAPTPPPPAQSSSDPPLMLIHGTVLPTSQSNRPVWSVPGVGALFKYLQASRPGLYGKPDYFRWEGGYTDYAREVASQSLSDWLQLRKLAGTDAVAHSHGCNVLMQSTTLAGRFRKVVLLSCPVHWAKYSMKPTHYSAVVSARIKYDLVIAVDRGGQRFPAGTIPDHVLPYWFNGHSDTTTPLVWQTENLVAHL